MTEKFSDSTEGSGSRAVHEKRAIVADEFTLEHDKEYEAPMNSLTGESAPKSAKADTVKGESAKSNETLPSDASTKAEKGTKDGKLVVRHSMRHEVCYPENYPYVPLSEHVSAQPTARTYKFTLDPFQSTSVMCIERNESVLVAAHTSAGKTVIAEYAIALALKNKERVIYTSPIKALSNQKYRDFAAEFGDVGLMTGDVTLNPSASCLVMTTEILRSMLYRGSEIMREVSWIVFDEIHYMRDKARGFVWEETIVLLPDKVRYVFLSATIPNAKQFADWIARVHDQACHVVYTDYRPTPLQHYVFPAGGDGIHLCVDEKGSFRDENFNRAISQLAGNSEGGDGKSKNAKRRKVTAGGAGGSNGNAGGDLFKIIKMILVKKYHPVIVFSFSKRECEAYAAQVSKLDFNDDQEKEMIETIYNSAIAVLSDEDKKLPQITGLLPLLKRGIGIHHSGLLPLIKEIIEILFQENLIKVLMATETFSIGLNMPARTVVFTNARKFDGKEQRLVSGAEYIQMSGRAGRRGLDDRGIVILMLDEKIQPENAQQILKGQADNLNSAFQLKYNMVLNLLRIEGMAPEVLLKRTFYQFQNTTSIPQMQVQLTDLESHHNALTFENESELSRNFAVLQQLREYKRNFYDIVFSADKCIQFMQVGRLVQVRDPDAGPWDRTRDYGWGIVVTVKALGTAEKQHNQTSGNNHKRKGKEIDLSSDQSIPDVADFLVDVAVNCVPTENNENSDELPLAYNPLVHKGIKPVPKIISVTLRSFYGISVNKFTKLQQFLDEKLYHKLSQSISMITTLSNGQGPPLMHPITGMQIHSEAFVQLLAKIAALEKISTAKDANGQPKFDMKALEAYETKHQLSKRIQNLKKGIAKVNAVIMLEDLQSRKRVLRRLGYVNDADVIQTKGRVACEISTGDELLLTELMFNGTFAKLSCEECAALLSCFVFDEKADDSLRLSESLDTLYKSMQEAARNIGKVLVESKQCASEDEYLQQFCPNMMEVVYQWMQGAPFSQIMKMTSIFEGSIVRCMRRLEELCKQMSQASKAIGNTEMETKFADAIAKMKRGIVFTTSLYLQ